MTYDGLSRISVCVLDEGGLLQVRGEEGHYSGVMPRVPPALSIGDSVHVRLTLPGGHGALDVLGIVVLLEGGTGPVALSDGLIFEVSVSHASRHQPDGSPAPAELALDELLEDEPFESPIHFGVAPPRSEEQARPVDVERREVSYDPAAHYVPLPLSTPDGAVIEDDDVELDEEKLRAAAKERSRALRERFVEEVERPAAPPYLEDDDEDDEERYVRAGDPDEDPTVHHRSGSRRGGPSVHELTEPSGVVGTLREMPLTEVVQTLGFSGKTAAVDVRPKGVDLPVGVVYLERGNVVYARCGALEGEEAFFTLAAQKRGVFLIRFHEEAPATNVHSPTAFLLLEALRRHDEENHERNLVEAVAEEAAAEEAAAALDALGAPTSDGLDDADDRTVLSETLSRGEHEDDPSAELEAEAAAAPREVELDDEAIEESLVAEEPARHDDDDDDGKGERPYATASPTTIFSRFFEEASEDDEPPEAEEGEGDEFSDPTFSGLKAALKGLKGGEEDTLAVFHQPIRSGSFPSYS